MKAEHDRKNLVVVVGYYGNPVENLQTQARLIKDATSRIAGINETRIIVSGHDSIYHTADSEKVESQIARGELGENVSFLSTAEGTFAFAYLNAYREAANDNKAKYVVIMDSGLSHDPNDLHLFVEGLQKGADVVAGSRNVSGARNEYPWHRKLVSSLGTFLSQNFLGLKLKDCTSGYIGYTRDALQRLLEFYPVDEWISKDIGPYFLQTEERFITSLMGLKIIEEPIQYGVLNGGRGGILKSQILVRAAMGLFRLMLKQGDLKRRLGGRGS